MNLKTRKLQRKWNSIEEEVMNRLQEINQRCTEIEDYISNTSTELVISWAVVSLKETNEMLEENSTERNTVIIPTDEFLELWDWLKAEKIGDLNEQNNESNKK